LAIGLLGDCRIINEKEFEVMKKIMPVLIGVVACFLLVACGEKSDPNTVRVGTISGPETQLMEVAKKVAKQRYGLNVKIITFSDYSIPNVALADGSLDANAFQHLPYLKAQIKQHGFQFVAVGKTFLYPMAIYSKKITSLSQLKSRDKVAIPNDPSNEARALLLLQNAKLIRLRRGAGTNATPIDIVNNPKQLQFIALDAAELPRTLRDVVIAVINTNYAVPAGLSPAKDALFEEKSSSPYTNLIVVRRDDKNLKKVRNFVAAFQSEKVARLAKKIFGDAAIAGF
jgi:D-methionine transport system substrate-binding protein